MKFATPSSLVGPARSRSRYVDDPAVELVRRSLAQHLGIDAGEIHEGQDLEEGLGLDPLDLVLVALRLEELGEVEFPVAELEGIATVADLAAMVRRWWQSARCSRSGTHLRAVWPARSTQAG